MEISISCEPYFHTEKKDLIKYVKDIIELSKETPTSIHFDLFEFNEEIVNIMGECAKKISVNVHSRLDNLSTVLNKLTQYPFNSISVHPEQYQEKTLLMLQNQIKQFDIKNGLVFDVSTSVDENQLAIRNADAATIMTTDYNSSSGVFESDALKKISEIREINPNIDVTVDGGVNENTICELQGMGVQSAVMGNCARKYYEKGELDKLLKAVSKQKFSHCIFCDVPQNQKNRFLVQPLERQLLYKDDDFYIKVGKGAIIPGYLVIIPNKHVLSTANLPQEQKRKLFKLLGHTKDILEETFEQPVMYFESGTPLGGTKFSNSIVHAHVHSAPLKVSPENDKLMKEQMFLEPFDYRNRLSELENKSYSLLIDSNDNGFASTSLNRPRQIFRKVIAKQIGKEDAWNWREKENESMENIIKTVDLLRPKLKKLNILHSGYEIDTKEQQK